MLWITSEKFSTQLALKLKHYLYSYDIALLTSAHSSRLENLLFVEFFRFRYYFFFSNIMDYYQSTIILSIYFNQFDRLEMKNISCHQSRNIPWKHHFNYIIHTCIVNWKAIIVSFYLRYNIVKYMGTGRVYWFCVIRKYEINVKLFYLNHPKFGFKIKNRKN